MSKSREERNARRKRHQELRRTNRKKTHEIARQLMSELRSAVYNCGLKESQVADFGGIDPGTVKRVMRSYHRTARVTTLVGILDAAGCYLKVCYKEPQDDEFRSERRFAPPPVEGK